MNLRRDRMRWDGKEMDGGIDRAGSYHEARVER